MAVTRTTAWRPLPWRARSDGQVPACARPPSLSGTFLWPASFFFFGWDRRDLRLLVQPVTEFLLFPALAMSFLAGFFALESPVKRDGVGMTLRHLISPALKTPAAHVHLYRMPTPPSLVGGRHRPPMGNRRGDVIVHQWETSRVAHKRHRTGPALASTRIMASCHVWRSWMAWQLIRRLCPALYRRYGPDLALPGRLANPLEVFEALLTYKNYNWGHFVTFVVWMSSHYSAGGCWRCYRQMRKAYPWAIPTWHALLRRCLGLFLLRP